MLAPINPQVTPSIPLDIRKELVNPFTPWEVSQELFARLQFSTPQAKYRKVRVLPDDKEWRFIWRYFHFQKPVRYGIKQVHFIHERHQQKAFEIAFSSIEREADTFPPTWNQESRAPQRAQAIQRWKETTQIFSPFTTQEPDGRNRNWKATKIVPLWHGTNEPVCDSICTSGFVYFGKNTIPGAAGAPPKITDDGYFGSGIYFTNSARYAADIYSKGHLLLGWVSMREPFPVVGDPNQIDMNTLRGRGAYKNYNAHYVPVASINPGDPDCPEYHPVQEHQSPACDEYVIFQKAQALPQYWVELEVEFPYMIIPGNTPQSVRELLPHIMKTLENPIVDRDEKLRNLLNKHLTILVQLPVDEDLTQEQIELYEQMINLLTPQGVINKALRNQMVAVASAQPLVVAQIQKKVEVFKAGQNFLGDEEKGPPNIYSGNKQSLPSVGLAQPIAQPIVQPKGVPPNISKKYAPAPYRRVNLEKVIEDYITALWRRNESILEEFKNDREVILGALHKPDACATEGRPLEYASDQLKNDREFVLAVIRIRVEALQYASEELKNDKEVVLAAIQIQSKGSWPPLRYASKQLQNDKEMVLASIQKNGMSLHYASDQLKNDREVVIAAVQKDGSALEYASDQLKNDREVVLVAVQQKPGALHSASEQLKKNREVVLAAVQKNGSTLVYASAQLKNDREIVLAAVNQWGKALQSASAQLQNDKEIVLAAVQQDGLALQYANKRFCNDKEIVLTAVQQDQKAFQYAGIQLQNDKEIQAIAGIKPSCVIS